MEGYVQVFSTPNYILLHQVEQAILTAGIDAQVKGRKASEIGNVELTGIQGASVWVPKRNEDAAKEVLQEMDLDTEESTANINSIIIGLGILLVCVVIFMIVKALW